MSIWQNTDGNPITDADGKIIECDDCPCDGEPGVPCGNCSGTTPLQLSLTVPGGSISGAGCSDYTGTFILTQEDGEPCIWIYTFANGSTWEVDRGFFFGLRAILLIRAGGFHVLDQIVYSTISMPSDCQQWSSLSLSLESTGTGCVGSGTVAVSAV